MKYEATCVPCGHKTEKKWLERGCECKCHTGVAVYPRLWNPPPGYKFGTTDQNKRTRKSLGIKGAKDSKHFRRLLRMTNDAA